MADGLEEKLGLVIAWVLELVGVGLGMSDVARGLPQALNTTTQTRKARRRIERLDCLLGVR
jgi:hypothetical protein